MIVYFDTSALVKRYLLEADSDAVMALWTQAVVSVASEIVYDEMAATFARKRREVPADTDLLVQAQGAFRAEWVTMRRVAVSDEVHRRVDELLERHALRGADAIHLASAIVYRELVRRPLTFACADHALLRAARHEGLLIAP